MNAKQQAFLEHYLQCWNAAEAARLAGYSVKAARQIGARLLTNDDIKLAIKERLTELQMGADEVLVRLSHQARANMLDFVDQRGRVNIFDREALDKLMEAQTKEAAAQLELEALRRRRLGPLVKKYKTRERKLADTSIEIYTELELYSAQEALALLGKHHKLFTETIEINWRNKLEAAGIDPAQVFNELVRAAQERLEDNP